MNARERFRGHFYNWYDTKDCHPLDPKYVSSVDSGNLAGHLIALAHACEEMIDRPRTVTRGRLDEAIDAVMAAVQEPPHDASEWVSRLATLKAHAHTVLGTARALTDEDPQSAQTDVLVWADAPCATVESHARDLDMPDTLIRRLTILARSARATVGGMDFRFLFDPTRKLLAIGYRVTDGSLDPGPSDLLASQARLASFVAIAKGDVPVSHWFRLGRALTPVEQDSVLGSWAGSMFEYLRPALVMRAPAGSLLDQTSRLAVARQITYGAEGRAPWGLSESR